MADFIYARFLARAACAVAVLLTPLLTHAQQYPNRPIRLIVPFQPGGAVDTTARVVSEALGSHLGQTIVVENRLGAGGVIGTNAVARAAPDGYTILFGVLGPLGLAPALNDKLPYDPVTDFAPVSLIAFYPNTVLFNKNAPFKTIPELIAAARNKPDSITYATGGAGTILHLSAELFSKMAGIKLVHVPYKGGLEAMPDLTEGRVPILFANIALSLPHLNSPRVAVVAVTGSVPSPLLPNVPTLARAAGLPSYETADWFGVLAPAATPRAIINTLHAGITKVLQTPAIATRLTQTGAQISIKTPEEFGTLIRTDVEKWKDVTKSAGIKIQ